MTSTVEYTINAKVLTIKHHHRGYELDEIIELTTLHVPLRHHILKDLVKALAIWLDEKTTPNQTDRWMKSFESFATSRDWLYRWVDMKRAYEGALKLSSDLENNKELTPETSNHLFSLFHEFPVEKRRDFIRYLQKIENLASLRDSDEGRELLALNEKVLIQSEYKIRKELRESMQKQGIDSCESALEFKTATAAIEASGLVGQMVTNPLVCLVSQPKQFRFWDSYMDRTVEKEGPESAYRQILASPTFDTMKSFAEKLDVSRLKITVKESHRFGYLLVLSGIQTTPSAQSAAMWRDLYP